MRNADSSQGTSDNNYNNAITQDIDAQLIVAPQYGIMGSAPKFDPPPQTRAKKGGVGLSVLRRKSKLAQSEGVVRRQRTKDLKILISILVLEIALVKSGDPKMAVGQNVLQAMETRLKLMQEEKAIRDVRDLANGKTPPNAKAFTIGDRLRAA